jgi:hypothetical protein
MRTVFWLMRCRILYVAGWRWTDAEGDEEFGESLNSSPGLAGLGEGVGNSFKFTMVRSRITTLVKYQSLPQALELQDIRN